MKRRLTASPVWPLRAMLMRADPRDRRPRGAPDLRLLTPILELVPPAPAPPDLLLRIEQRIGAERGPRHAPRRQFARAWLLGAAMGAAAAIALAPLLQDRAPDTALPLSVVDGAERVAMLGAQTFLRGQYLRIDHFGLRPAAGHALQLWLVRDGSGRPRSLGLLATGDSVTVLPLSERIESGDVLAVSEEPPGGSPGSGPSGPVIITARVGTKI